MNVPEQIIELINAGALVVCNTSGGKDSQAMTIHLSKIVPAGQLILVHAHLPEVEWEGVKEHIEATALGIPVYYCQAQKTFFQMVDHRQKFPSPKYRQCTSDLKRGPIEKFIRHYMKEHGFTTVINCMGLRAQESTSRAKKQAFKQNDGNSIAGRTWYDWLPIHDMLLDEVWTTIANAGQVPHWAYGEGMTRLSCCFCIMSSKPDLRTAARLRPQLLQRYKETEVKYDFAMMSSPNGAKIFLDEYIKE